MGKGRDVAVGGAGSEGTAKGGREVSSAGCCGDGSAKESSEETQQENASGLEKAAGLEVCEQANTLHRELQPCRILKGI